MIIGISGKMGTGKTTLAQLLQDLLLRDHLVGEGVPVIRAFGDVLKQEVAQEFNFPLEWCYTQQGKLKFIQNQQGRSGTVRELLQYWGTDVRRAQDSLYWTRAMARTVATDLRQGNHIIVHDVRFLNEARWVKEQGGIVVRLEPYEGWKEGQYAQHESEKNLDDYPDFDEVLHPGLDQQPAAARLVFKKALVALPR